MIKCSSFSRQLSNSMVSITPEAKIDLEFFLLRHKKYDLINCSPVCSSYPPNTARTKSNTHWGDTSPNVGLPAMSGMRSDLNTSNARSAGRTNSGSGIIDSPRFKRCSQSVQAVPIGYLPRGGGAV